MRVVFHKFTLHTCVNHLKYHYHEIKPAYIFAQTLALIFTGCVFLLCKCKVKIHQRHCWSSLSRFPRAAAVLFCQQKFLNHLLITQVIQDYISLVYQVTRWHCHMED